LLEAVLPLDPGFWFCGILDNGFAVCAFVFGPLLYSAEPWFGATVLSLEEIWEHEKISAFQLEFYPWGVPNILYRFSTDLRSSFWASTGHDLSRERLSFVQLAKLQHILTMRFAVDGMPWVGHQSTNQHCSTTGETQLTVLCATPTEWPGQGWSRGRRGLPWLTK